MESPGARDVARAAAELELSAEEMDAVMDLVEGCDGILHLGGKSVEGTFAEILNSNLIGLLGVLFPLGVAVAILRHNLFDIDTLLNRALVYGALGYVAFERSLTRDLAARMASFQRAAEKSSRTARAGSVLGATR